MGNFIQNCIYTSIGTLSITNEKFKELLEDLIQNNHYTQDEGKRIVDTFLFDLRQQVDQLNGFVLVKIDDLLIKIGLPNLNNLKDDVDEYVTSAKENPINLLKLPSKK